MDKSCTLFFVSRLLYIWHSTKPIPMADVNQFTLFRDPEKCAAVSYYGMCHIHMQKSSLCVCAYFADLFVTKKTAAN